MSSEGTVYPPWREPSLTVIQVEKLQIPSSNIQRNSKFQSPNELVMSSEVETSLTVSERSEEIGKK
jgi:hypothetical protein